MSTTTATLLIGSTNQVELIGLQDRRDNSFPTDAVVTADLADGAGVPVTGATGIAMAYVAGTTGTSTLYRGIIPHTVALVAGTYTATITATKSGNVRVFTVSATASAG